MTPPLAGSPSGSCSLFLPTMRCPKCGSENTHLHPHCNPFGDDSGLDIHCSDCGYEKKVRS